MFLRILKKDIRRKKSMNIILLLFVIICSMFLSSSVNNLIAVTNALDYFYEQSNATDYYVAVRDSDSMENWITDNAWVYDYEKQIYFNASRESIINKNAMLDENSSLSFTTLPSHYDFVFDQNDEKIHSLNDGEIALTNSICERNKLVIGDVIEFKSGDTVMNFTLAFCTKDMISGSDFNTSFNRAIISDDDFNTLKKTSAANVNSYSLYSIKTNNLEELRSDKNKYISSTLSEFLGTDLKMMYIMDLMMFAIFIVVSICLILIAFTLLRFTINTTIQEDYKEIGIMRAIGLPDQSVITVYLVKYLTIAVLGSMIGTCAGLPFGELMMGALRKNIVMNPGSDLPIIPVLSAICIVIILFLFCRYSAYKILQLSAIQAIRNGSSGKRYSRKGKLRLKHFKNAGTVLFMTLNDITVNRKNYIVLFITFIIGAVLFLFPAKATSTLKSDEIIRYMGMSKPDVFIMEEHQSVSLINPNYNVLINSVQELEQVYKEAGISIDLYQSFLFSSNIYKEDAKMSMPCYISQATEDININIALLEGSYPEFADEIIATSKTMKKLDVQIGDSINIVIGDDDREYIIVGSYESMMNMGDGIFLSCLADTDFKLITYLNAMSGVFLDRNDIDGQIDGLRQAMPDFEIMSAEKYAHRSLLPGIVDMITEWKDRLGGVLLVIFCLVSVLMSRTFYTKDLGDIALLKSIGFSNKTLHFWQVLRISIAMLIATIIGFILSIPITPLLNRFTFGIMGAPNIPTTVNYIEAYIFYPLIMFAGVGISIYISTLTIRRVSMRDLGAIE